MKKILLIIFGMLVFIPGLVYGSTASDFQVNNQSTYAVPPGSTKVLILDLTLPATGLSSIKIFNAGTVQQSNLSQIVIYEDGPSAGWDGDESERVRKSFSPFFDTELIGDFSKQRIFVTVDIDSDTYTGKTIKPELAVGAAVFSEANFNGPTDEKVVGFERMVLAGANTPSVPFSPTVKNGEAVATSTIRWYFTDASDNEFGFKILDGNLKIVARKEAAGLSYLDETELNSNTEYSGRRVVAFNDVGESQSSALSIFPAVTTLALPVMEVVKPAATTTEEVTTAVATEQVIETEKPVAEMTADEIKDKIAELQLQLITLLNQLIQLLQEQLASVL